MKASHLLNDENLAPEIRFLALEAARQGCMVVREAKLATDDMVMLIMSDDDPSPVHSAFIATDDRKLASLTESVAIAWQFRSPGGNDEWASLNDGTDEVVAIAHVSQCLTMNGTLTYILEDGSAEQENGYAIMECAYADQSWATGFLNADGYVSGVMSSQPLSIPSYKATPMARDDPDAIVYAENIGIELPRSDADDEEVQRKALQFRLLALLTAEDDELHLIPGSE